MLWLSLVSPTPRTERMLSPTWNQTMHEQKLSSKLKNNSLVEMFEIPLRLYQQDVYIHCIDRKLNCWRVGMPTISLYLNTINDAIDFINLHSFFQSIPCYYTIILRCFPWFTDLWHLFANYTDTHAIEGYKTGLNYSKRDACHVSHSFLWPPPPSCLAIMVKLSNALFLFIWNLWI